MDSFGSGEDKMTTSEHHLNWWKQWVAFTCPFCGLHELVFNLWSDSLTCPCPPRRAMLILVWPFEPYVVELLRYLPEDRAQ